MLLNFFIDKLGVLSSRPEVLVESPLANPPNVDGDPMIFQVFVPVRPMLQSARERRENLLSQRKYNKNPGGISSKRFSNRNPLAGTKLRVSVAPQPRNQSHDGCNSCLGSPYFRETFGSSFSAVSTPLIARVGSFFSIFRDLQDFQSFAPLETQNNCKMSSDSV